MLELPLSSLNREYNDLVKEIKVCVSEAFDGAEFLDDDWDASSDIAVALIKIAAEIVIREEVTLFRTLGSKDLFLEWCERSYDAAGEHALKDLTRDGLLGSHANERS